MRITRISRANHSGCARCVGHPINQDHTARAVNATIWIKRNRLFCLDLDATNIVECKRVGLLRFERVDIHAVSHTRDARWGRSRSTL